MQSPRVISLIAFLSPAPGTGRQQMLPFVWLRYMGVLGNGYIPSGGSTWGGGRLTFDQSWGLLYLYYTHILYIYIFVHIWRGINFYTQSYKLRATLPNFLVIVAAVVVDQAEERGVSWTRVRGNTSFFGKQRKNRLGPKIIFKDSASFLCLSFPVSFWFQVVLLGTSSGPRRFVSVFNRGVERTFPTAKIAEGLKADPPLGGFCAGWRAKALCLLMVFAYVDDRWW